MSIAKHPFHYPFPSSNRKQSPNARQHHTRDFSIKSLIFALECNILLNVLIRDRRRAAWREREAKFLSTQRAHIKTGGWNDDT